MKNGLLKEHINLRSAQIIFMFLTCELAIAFSFCAQSQSFVWAHRCLIRGMAGIGLVPAVIQQIIGFKIDLRFANEHGGESDDTTIWGSDKVKQ